MAKILLATQFESRSLQTVGFLYQPGEGMAKISLATQFDSRSLQTIGFCTTLASEWL